MKGSWKRVAGALIAVLLLVSFATPVFAQPGDPEAGPDLVRAHLWLGEPRDFGILATVTHPFLPGRTARMYAWCPSATRCELEYEEIYEATIWTSMGVYPDSMSWEGYTVSYLPDGVIHIQKMGSGRAYASFGWLNILPPGTY